MTDAAGSNGEDNDQHIPGNADLRAFLQVLIGAHGHKAHNDVRHTEITETPAQTGNNVFPAGEKIPVIGRQVSHALGSAAALDDDQGKDRGDQKRREHQHALEEIRPANGGETAEKGVAHNDRGSEIHRKRCVDPDDRMEKRAAGLHRGGGINRISHEENNGADDLQRLGLAHEAVGQILRNCDGVIGNDRKAAKSRRLDRPTDGIADRKTDRHPRLTDAEGVDGSRQTHEHPCAHIGGACRQRGHPGSHLAPAKEVILFSAILGFDKEVNADTEHKCKVHHKNDAFQIEHS